MFDIGNIFKVGKNNSLLVKNNGSFSHDGPFVYVLETTLLDRWYINNFSTVEYSISVDLNTQNKEFIKVVAIATLDTVVLTEIFRTSTNRRLVEVSATVNSSYVDILITPTETADDSSTIKDNLGSKVIYTASYFGTQNPLSLS